MTAYRTKMYFSEDTVAGILLHSLAARVRKEEAKRFVKMGDILTTSGWSVPDFLIVQRRSGEGGIQLKGSCR